MKILIVVVVYNRLDNVRRWLRCWSQCEKMDAELIIIHNDNSESEKFRAVCNEAGIRYIRRENIGYDIGALQDVFKERLDGFPNDWTHLLWVTDDTWMMTKNFIEPFINKVNEPGVGVSCMTISKSVNAHVRTTGFCISKEVAEHIQFPADPVTTKQQCYLFEHRGVNKTLTNQIRALGLSCVQVAPSPVSPLWDTGYWKRLNREAEHEKVFPSGKVQGDKVLFICPIYNSYPGIISSLILQTHQNWELLLIHDGPSENGLQKTIRNFEDERVKYYETSEHKGLWGHYIRRDTLNEIKDRTDIDYVVISNPDNYMTPVFLEYLINGFKKSHTAVATYCSDMVHNYKAWQVIPVKFERGYIDCGGVMVKKDIACEVGFRDIDSHSADWVYFSDIASKYSARNFLPVKGCLFVHN